MTYILLESEPKSIGLADSLWYLLDVRIGGLVVKVGLVREEGESLLLSGFGP